MGLPIAFFYLNKHYTCTNPFITFLLKKHNNMTIITKMVVNLRNG